MSRKSIGAASDFYRVRVMHFDESDAPDLEWRDDILWRRPPVQAVGEYEIWRVEAVSVDDDDDVTVLGMFAEVEDAHEALETTEEDIAQLTKSEFEEKYFPADE